MANPFDSRSLGMAGPGIDYVPVTASDSVALTDVAIALYVETGGAVSFISQKGNTRTVTVPDFGWILCGVKQVLSTGTTATGIHALVIV